LSRTGCSTASRTGGCGWALPAERDGRAATVAALAAIVPVGVEAMTVVGVLSTAARGISRTLGDPAAESAGRAAGG